MEAIDPDCLHSPPFTQIPLSAIEKPQFLKPNGLTPSKLAVQIESTAPLKVDTIASPAEVHQVESLAQCSPRHADQSSKSLMTRLIASMHKRKLKSSKKAQLRQSGSDLDLLFAQAEATLGELLVRAGASFARVSSTSQRMKRNSLSRIWQLGGKVFCGSGHMMKGGNEMELAPEFAPLDFEEEDEEYWQSLAEAMVQGNNSTVELEECGTPTVDSDAKSSALQDDRSSIHRRRLIKACSKSEIMEDMCGQRLRRRSSDAGECSSFRSLRDGLMGGSTRLNTMLEESPMLLHNHKRVAAARVRSRSSGGGGGGGGVATTEAAAQPLQAFLSLGGGRAASDSSGAGPSRVSLMALLQEKEKEEAAAAAAAVAAESHEESGGGLDALCCCICMVGRKGAALIPCGHTFCRSCSKHLWAHRGACPLCNTLITQVLDIF